jgi:hypothetical protein
VTTATFNGPSRLWRLRFKNGARPEEGGTISMMLDGTEGHHMLDKLTVNRRGQIFLQEDPCWRCMFRRVHDKGTTVGRLAAAPLCIACAGYRSAMTPSPSKPARIR